MKEKRDCLLSSMLLEIMSYFPYSPNRVKLIQPCTTVDNLVTVDAANAINPFARPNLENAQDLNIVIILFAINYDPPQCRHYILGL